jgi:hypothetical protein
MAAGLLKKNAAWSDQLADYRTRWNMIVPISRLDFSTAKSNPCLREPLNEKSFHCCGGATTKSRAI